MTTRSSTSQSPLPFSPTSESWETRHYLEEIARVHQTSGRALVTFFLLGGQGGQPTDAIYCLDFAQPLHSVPFAPLDAKGPEAAVAFPEELLDELSTAGLGIKPPITYGRWPEVAVGRDIRTWSSSKTARQGRQLRLKQSGVAGVVPSLASRS